jgi:hypothetical protein
MKKMFLIVLAVMILLPAALSAQSRPRLAILPFTGGVGTDGETISMLLGNQAELSRWAVQAAVIIMKDL